jgi:hypothetical protein
MGLDWVPIRKPMPGKEDEFAAVLAFLSRDSDPTSDDPVVARIRAMSTDEQRDLYDSISISPYETMGAPMVGRDPAADEFVSQTYRQRSSDPSFVTENPSVQKFLQEMKGYYATEVMPRSAGLPFYQTTVGEHIDFRAKFLDDVEDLIGDELYEESFENKFACADALDYAARLRAKAAEHAKEHGAMKLEMEWALPFFARFSKNRMQAHILFSAINWIRFWANLGHGYRADF